MKKAIESIKTIPCSIVSLYPIFNKNFILDLSYSRDKSQSFEEQKRSATSCISSQRNLLWTWIAKIPPRKFHGSSFHHFNGIDSRIENTMRKRKNLRRGGRNVFHSRRRMQTNAANIEATRPVGRIGRMEMHSLPSFFLLLSVAARDTSCFPDWRKLRDSAFDTASSLPSWRKIIQESVIAPRVTVAKANKQLFRKIRFAMPIDDETQNLLCYVYTYK